MKITEIIESQTGSSQPEDQQNNGVSQQYEECVFSTLDALCRSQQQTYSQFMAQFTQLTSESVLPPAAPTDDGPPEEFLRFQASQRTRNNTQLSHTRTNAQMSHTNNCTQMLNTHGATHTGNSTQMLHTENSTTQSESVTGAPSSQPITMHDTNAIEEQVLQDGDRIQTYLHRSGQAIHRVQVGNYIDEPEESDHTEDTYMPSFGHDQNVSDISKSASHDSNQTAKQTPHVTHQPAQLDQSIGPSCDVKHQPITTKKTEIQTDQSEGILDLISADDNDIESDCSDLEYDPSLDTLNFGEIGDSSDSECKPSEKCLNENERTLEFTVVKEGRKQDGGNEASVTEHDSGQLENADDNLETDTVVAFELDTAFDYDHVTLTPKYSRQEMDILLTAARTGGNAEEDGDQ